MRNLPAPPDPTADPTADPFGRASARERLGTWRERLGTWMVVHPVQFVLAVAVFLGVVNGVSAWRGGETPGASVVAALAVGAMSFVLWGLLWRRVGRAASMAAERAAEATSAHDEVEGAEPRPAPPGV